MQRPSAAGNACVVGQRAPAGSSGSKRLVAVASKPTSALAAMRRFRRRTLKAVGGSTSRLTRVPSAVCTKVSFSPVTADITPTVVLPPIVPETLAAP